MIIKVIVTLLRKFLGLHCQYKLIIRLTHNVFLMSILFRIVSSLNHIDLPLFMINKESVNYYDRFYSVMSFQAYYKANSQCFVNVVIIQELF